MKKIVLTCAIALSCLIASANFATTSLVNTNSLDILRNQQNFVNDSTIICETYNNAVQELSYMAFYDIDRLAIYNKNKEYIRIEDNKGQVVIESHDSIDIILPAGNYYVYTTARLLKGSYK